MGAAVRSLVNRIDALTPEQAARMPEWRDKWIAVGLRTGPSDRPAFERHVAACYRAATMDPPKRIIWVPSPWALAIRAPTEAFMLGLSDRIAKAELGAQINAQVDDQVRDQVNAQVNAQVRAQVNAQVNAQVRAQVRDQVGAIMAGLYRAISGSWHHYMGGQFWVGGWYWGTAYQSYFRDVCGLDIGEEMAARAIAYAGTCEAACWWWPHKDFVMVCERPIHIDRDAQGRLHSDTRLAIEWPDGWGIAMSHGVRLPDDVILRPESVTVARIDAEKNAEVRRVMLERFGLARYMLESKAEVLHEDTDQLGHPRRLLRKPMGDGLPELTMVHVKNSTLEPDGSRKDYVLAVHPQLRPIFASGFGPPQKLTCANAVASTFGLRGEEYAPQAET